MRHGGKYEALFCILTRAVDMALLHGDGEPGCNNEEKRTGTLSGAFAKQRLEKSKRLYALAGITALFYLSSRF